MLSPYKQALLDELMQCWSAWDTHENFYLQELAPKIARSSEFGWMPESERRVVTALRRALSPEEWEHLPKALAWQREEHHRSAMAKLRQEEEREHARAAERRRRQASTVLRDELTALCQTDFLAVRDHSAENAGLLTPDEVDEVQAQFAYSWFNADRVPEEMRLDLSQARAVSAHGDVQLVARAGSGKTRTIAARALFLVDHCRVSPGDLLLLAFNATAAKEMRDRLEPLLGARLPHIMTFHALAYAVVHPEQDLLVDDAKSDALGLSREIQEVIDDHLRDPESHQLIRSAMLAHFRTDWDRIEQERLHLSRDDLLKIRRALPRETLNGEQVKSYGEKLIANLLFEHGVAYKYERNYRWDGQNYRPDFTIFRDSKSGVILEYFGLAGDPDYDAMSDEKRRFWQDREGWTLVECGPSDVSQEGFAAALLARLRDLGLTVRRRTEDEIWQLVRRRAVDRFTGAVKGFVGQARKRSFLLADVRQLLSNHEAASEAERLFLDVAASVYAGYLERIAAQGQEDFDGLLTMAVDRLNSGHTRFVRSRGHERGDLATLRFLMVDEFQDLSPQFFDLIKAIRRHSPSAEFFGVGDDFQAINGFAGSDLSYFREFETHFPRGRRLWLRNNYRSSAAVVNTSNELMRGRGEQAKAMNPEQGIVGIAWLDEFAPTPTESDLYPGDEITPAILRLAADRIEAGEHVAILSRTNYVPWYVAYREADSNSKGIGRFVKHLQALLPDESADRLDGSTVHRFKGMEAETVIVLDALERRYPLIHPNWIFTRVFGNSIQAIEDEERRLFYVALTRAKTNLYLISEHSSASAFLEDIGAFHEVIDVNSLKTPRLTGTPRFEIRVYGAFEVKDYLKALGYRYYGCGKYWACSVQVDAFDADDLVNSEWFARVQRVDVIDQQGKAVLLPSARVL